MIYSCKDCYYLFESSDKPERCPDCGKKNIAYANAEEIEEYKGYHEAKEETL